MALSGSRRPDVVVVGAGAIGAACAYELAVAGARVTVIERAEPAAEALWPVLSSYAVTVTKPRM